MLRICAASFYVLVGASILFLAADARTQEPAVEGREIFILQRSNHQIPPVDHVVLAKRQALKDYIRSQRPVRDAPMDWQTEQEVLGPFLEILIEDPTFLALRADYQTAVAHMRADRGALRKASNQRFLDDTEAILQANGVVITRRLDLAGIIAVDGDDYNPESIAALVDGVVEAYPPLDLAGFNTLAETRMSWLHGWGSPLTGSGQDVLVVDTGVDTTITDIVGGHTILANRDSGLCHPFDTSADHGTRIASIIGSSNATAKGGAFGYDKMFVSSSNDSTCDGSRAAAVVVSVSWGVADTPNLGDGDTPEVLSLSHGHTSVQEYTGYAKFFDAMVDEFSLFAAVAVGNYHPHPDSLSKVNDVAHGYNSVGVTALESKGDSLRANDEKYDGFPSYVGGGWGPTVDERKKPDLCAPVTDMWTQTVGGDSIQEITAWSSMASPQVAAAGMLLSELGAGNEKSIGSVLKSV